jgi:uncharacterized protein involved in cysteine biosynthesis
MRDGSKTSTSGMLIALASGLVAAGLYYADQQNLPVIAPWLDLLSDKIYAWVPILGQLLPTTSLVLGPIVAAFAFFLIATVACSFFVPSVGHSDRIERQLRQRASNKRRLDDDGFRIR